MTFAFQRDSADSMFTRRDLLRSVALASTAAALERIQQALAPISGGRQGSNPKDIAEAGFIYGLPIVMNYAVMYEYAVDRSSGQFKAPFNQIVNEHRVYTYKDTAIITPNSDTPYSGGFLDLRAEPLVLSVPDVDLKRYYSVMLTDGSTYNYGYMETELLIKNPINRYLINAPMLPDLKKNPDGSLTIYIQNKSPGADKEANWLPAPDGPAYLQMRLYWPKDTPPSILPPGKGTWRPPGVVRVS